MGIAKRTVPKETADRIVSGPAETDVIARNAVLGNFFNNEGYLHLLVAGKLGHSYNPDTQGPDGNSEAGVWREGKSSRSVDGCRFAGFLSSAGFLV